MIYVKRLELIQVVFMVTHLFDYADSKNSEEFSDVS
jgi:hypothetical protein